MTDIAGDCLRCGQCEGYGCSCTTEEQQSAHIDQLLARIERLRSALTEMTEICSSCTFETIRIRGQYVDRTEAVYRAREALKGTDQ